MDSSAVFVSKATASARAPSSPMPLSADRGIGDTGGGIQGGSTVCK